MSGTALKIQLTNTAPGLLIWNPVGGLFLTVFKLTVVRLLLARLRVRLAGDFGRWLLRVITCALARALNLGRGSSSSCSWLTLASFGGLGHADRCCGSASECAWSVEPEVDFSERAEDRVEL